jgi:hypothetical protein
VSDPSSFETSEATTDVSRNDSLNRRLLLCLAKVQTGTHPWARCGIYL